MCWMGWKQAKVPISKKLLEYISQIDIISDMKKITETVKIRPVIYIYIYLLLLFFLKIILEMLTKL